MHKSFQFIVFGGLLCGLFLLAACQGEGGSATGSTSGSEQMTENGFKYVHHVKNDGAKPVPGQYVYFHYELRVDDSLLDGSRTRGFVPKMEIPTPDKEDKANPSPVLDAVKLMAVGDSMTIIYPMDSLPQRPPQFPNAENLYYEVTLNNIKSKEEFEAEQKIEQEEQAAQAAVIQVREADVAAKMTQTAKDYAAGKLRSQLKSTPSGLKYIIHEQGTGAFPSKGERVNVHYYGTLTDGTMFDNSFKRGQAFGFALQTGAVIPGWDEGIALLKKGGSATLFIPYELGYGERGSPPNIPPKAELLFYVELQEK